MLPSRTGASKDKIIIGRFGAPFGVKGWIKVISFTDPVTNILEYQPWFIELKEGWGKITLEAGKLHSNSIIAKLAGCDDRNQAQTYTHKQIATASSQLPPTQENEYYWSDLEGLTVVNLQGEKLGFIKEIIATGANDVLIVNISKNKTIYIPFIKQAIIEVNLQKQQMVVDWGIDW